jgi:chemotaxis protein methyltransferase CheR
MNMEHDPFKGPAESVPTTMSDADFEAFSRVIHDQTGIVINAGKRSLLVSRLSRRLRKLGLSDFTAYRRLIESRDQTDEHRELISAVTTNVTGFFREPAHFEALSRLIPFLEGRTRKGERVRIWSAGCSSGEEPYSIAMTLHEKWRGLDELDIRILATDIDAGMIEKARQGAFDAQSAGHDAPPILRRYVSFHEGEDRFFVHPSLKKIIRFEELNLLDPWPFNGKFDVIFCRNVVIYFDADTRRLLWRRFAERLHPGGMLFIGHSERITAELEPFLEPVGVTQYRRTPLRSSATAGPTASEA